MKLINCLLSYRNGSNDLRSKQQLEEIFTRSIVILSRMIQDSGPVHVNYSIVKLKIEYVSIKTFNNSI